MKTTTILHLTDIHFDSPLSKPAITIKEPVSKTLIDKLGGTDCRTSFMSCLRDYSTSKKIDLIAFTGDLGWAAKNESIKKGTDFIAQLALDLGVKPNCVIVAPGNHDLNRQSSEGKELDDFYKACANQGFLCVNGEKPVTKSINGVNIIAINSCLGGTEKTIPSVPDEVWTILRDTLAEQEKKVIDTTTLKDTNQVISSQLKELDISAIGTSQLDEIGKVINRGKLDFVLLLMHHNIIPSANIEIRPYFSTVDSGRLLSRLLEYGRHIVILHGHSHTTSALEVHSLKNGGVGFVACIGNKGLSAAADSEAYLIEVMNTDSGNFIRAEIYAFVRNGSTYEKNYLYSLAVKPDKYFNPLWSIVDLRKGKLITFDDAVALLKITDKDLFAKELIQMDDLILTVSGKDRPPKEWRIIRRI